MLELKNISKSFSGIHALRDVSFSIQPGEVHAVCGENGAGKSTLMNIVCGNLQPDYGTIMLENKVLRLRSHQEARDNGIAIVYQERSLIGTLSVAENIFLNHSPTRYGFIDYGALYSECRKVLDRLQLAEVQPDQKADTLSQGQRLMVDIAKAIVTKPNILILDEPTAAIAGRETNVLFGLLRELQKTGVAIVYISHRLKEIFEIAQRVTVLKDGRWQTTLSIHDVTEASLIHWMVGRTIDKQQFKSVAQKEMALEVRGLSGRGFSNISFTVAKGEIVALAGLMGAGRTEIAKTIFGALPRLSGDVKVQGTPRYFHHPMEAIQHGVAYLAEERKEQSIFPEMTLAENIMAAKYAGAGFQRNISHQETDDISTSFRDMLRISTPSLSTTIRKLSGGNQQKAVLARWLAIQPAVLMVDEPSQGVDVGVKFEIYQLLHDLARNGTAILLISSDMQEVLTIANRIIVITGGSVAGELAKDEATEDRLLTMASGLLSLTA